MIKQRFFKYFLPILIAILMISLASITSCKKEGPFIPEYIAPIDGYYTEMTLLLVEEVMLSDYNDPKSVMQEWAGKSLVIKNIKVDEYALSTLEEDHIHFNILQCIPQKPADLLELKKGDVIDLTGVFVDIPLVSGVRTGVVVMANCQFLPAGVYPIPLPGGPGPIGGY